ncbi:hypothetical protein L9F63_019489 [Diploptera punctata]|uniref:Uncharacterized protein n=1 Tax=Diploptera punctata TaxID=6984 RepID=A0AAD7ZW66_DIPPU|nr:hypothetical protein L9F63_019489 [Diploptera punctata]
MKGTTIIVFVLLLEIFLSSPALGDTVVDDKDGFAREKRWGPNCGGPGDCPPHHCSRDDGVLVGYCCGCAQPGDRVPIPCPPFLHCPPNSISLCSHYNYMMDCCC